MGKLKHVTKKYDHSNECYEKALALGGDIDELEINYNIGVNYTHIQKYVEGIQYFE